MAGERYDVCSVCGRIARGFSGPRNHEWSKACLQLAADRAWVPFGTVIRPEELRAEAPLDDYRLIGYFTAAGWPRRAALGFVLFRQSMLHVPAWALPVTGLCFRDSMERIAYLEALRLASPALRRRIGVVYLLGGEHAARPLLPVPG